MSTNGHGTLGNAVRARRNQLGLTIEEAVEQSRQIDLAVNYSKGSKPGVSKTTWSEIERAVERRDHRAATLRLIDQVLRWPEGTAWAHYKALELPDGPPAPGLESSDRAASMVETAGTRGEVDLLRREVLSLIERVSGVEESLQRVLKSLDR